MSDCRCGRATRDEAYACDDCGDRLTRALSEMPWLTDEIDVTLAGRKGIDYRRGGTPGGTEPRLPVHMAASDLLTDLRATLVSWVKFCDEEGVRHQSPLVGLPADNIPAMARWLMWRVDGLLLSELGPDAVDEITRLTERGTRLVDRPADKWYAGPCPQCGAGLYAVLGAKLATCRSPVKDITAEKDTCGHTVDVAARRAELLPEAEDKLLSAVGISRAVSWLGSAPLTADRVRTWATRGRILAHGHDGRSPLYRVGDAIDLLAAESKAG